MKKRLLASFLSLVMILALLPTAALAVDETSGNCGAEGNVSNVTWRLEQNNTGSDPDTYTLHIEGSGAMADYSVDTSNQATNGYYKVKDSPWLNYASQITKIELSTEITKIGQGAFNSCAITDLPWSDKEDQYSSLTEIGNFAFAGCTSLTSVTFVSSVETYGNYVFEGCTGLTTIDWTNYQPNTENSDKLSVNGVLVATGLFAECSSLTSNFNLPERITGIDRAAFRNTGYTAINFTTDAPGVNVIEEQAFYGSDLSSLILPSAEKHSDTKFGTNAFRGTDITTVTIPCYSQASGANISDGMFRDCKSLQTVVLGEGIDTIGDNAFNSSTLSNINWPTSLKTIGNHAFNGTKLVALELPSTITTIGNNAFYGIDTLKSVSIGASVISIGYAAFSQCASLETVDLSDVTSITCTASGTNSGHLFDNCKDGCVLYVTNDALIKDSQYPYEEEDRGPTVYSFYTTAAMVIGEGAEVDTSKTGFAAVSKGGYTAEWYTSSDFDTSTKVEEIGKTLSGNKVYPTYYAKWVSTITFNANGGTLSNATNPIIVEEGKAISTVSDNYALPTPTKSGSTFVGWNTAADGSGAPVTTATVPTGDMTIYAIWGTAAGESGYSIYPIEEQTYTGSPLTPPVYVVDSNGNKNIATAVTYENNTNAGTAKAKVTISGQVYSVDFTIKPAALTITADNKTVYVGGTLPQYTYTVSGLVGSDTEAVITTGPDFQCDAFDANTAGTYSITPSDADAGDNYTITYKTGTLTIATIENSDAFKVETSSLTEVPESLKSKYNDVNALTTALRTEVRQTNSSISNANIVVYDVTLMVNEGSGWVKADAEHFPSSGRLTVTLPYPTGTNNSYTFTVVHMFTTSDFSKTPGDTETPTVRNTADGIQFEVTGLSPISVGWVAPTSGNTGGGGGGTPTYTVSAPSNVAGGEVSVSPSRASYGSTVTITVDPDEGHELDTLTVTDASGNAVSVKKVSDTKYTFTMPRSRVTVEATFAEIVEEPALVFVDVPASEYYYDAVYWAAENGVTYGTSATTFSPDVIVSRAQMVTFLWRAHGSPEPRSSINPFTDVTSDMYYYDAVLWAVENGVTFGTSATTFSPEVTVTRAQAVTFQWRATGSPAVTGGSFADVAADAYYAGAVTWAVANGVTNGTGGNNFSPDAGVSRAQAVTFLYRQLG